LGGEVSSLYLVIYAIILVLVVLFRPGGIATFFQFSNQKLVKQEVKRRSVV